MKIWNYFGMISVERETGVEPATSSLGNWANIVNTDFSVSGSDFKRRKVTEFPILCSGLLLMEYKRSTLPRNNDNTSRATL